MANMNPKKHAMPSPGARMSAAHNFAEVALGYTAEIAIDGGRRAALNCKNNALRKRLPGQYQYPGLHRQDTRTVILKALIR